MPTSLVHFYTHAYTHSAPVHGTISVWNHLLRSLALRDKRRALPIFQQPLRTVPTGLVWSILKSLHMQFDHEPQLLMKQALSILVSCLCHLYYFIVNTKYPVDLHYDANQYTAPIHAWVYIRTVLTFLYICSRLFGWRAPHLFKKAMTTYY